MIGRYETTQGFRRAVQKEVRFTLSDTFWEVFCDIFSYNAIHEPYSDEDVKIAAYHVKACLKLRKRKHGRTKRAR